MKKDLLVIVADNTMEKVIKTLLNERKNSLGIRHITFDIRVMPNRDSDVYRNGPDFSQKFEKLYEKCMIIFDYHGCNSNMNVGDTRKNVLDRLSKIWGPDRCEVVLIYPELEIWIWGPKVIKKLFDILSSEYNITIKGNIPPQKPQEPKKEFHELLRRHGVPKSSSIYVKLAKTASLTNCRDSAFNLLVNTLRKWFYNS